MSLSLATCRAAAVPPCVPGQSTASVANVSTQNDHWPVLGKHPMIEGGRLPAQTWRTAMNIARSISSLAVLSLLAMAAASAQAANSNPLADKVRTALDRFKDVNVAVEEGYSPIPCASGVDGGAMGIHYVNGAYLKDDAVDLNKPEAVMYEPMPDGKLALIAVEYITTKGPASLENHLLSFTGTPNRYGLPAFYQLHVWAWKPNPAGAFADMNMNVSCEAAKS
jgi:hypothetical protein